ncbi:hypothetical protein ISP15_07730 [Dyella jejuensis]|uniref:Uncharacterized protein n=1 Tax=Dyella jejuensis TaxID=1432009 RepID=A0ABW8JGI9_9GAMM
MTLTVSATLPGSPPQGTPNDGIVDECSAKYGDFLGAYPFNHLDEVNRDNGVLGANAATADPVNLILQHASRLKQQGL